jgi:hypothetical protein
MYEYTNTILSVNVHNSSLRPFRVKEDSTALPAIPAFRESGSTNFSSAYPSRCRDLLAIFKGRTGNIPSARIQRVTSNKPVHSMSKFYKLNEPTGSD